LRAIEFNVLCKLNDNRFIKFFQNKSNYHIYSIYIKGNNNEIIFKSHFKKYKKTIYNQESNDPLLDSLRHNKLSELFELKSYMLETEKNISNNIFIKLLKLSDNKIIIFAKEDNKQIWEYNSKELN